MTRSKRRARGGEIVSPAEARVVGVLDDLIMDAVHELYVPNEPPYPFERIIEGGSVSERRFQEPLSAVRENEDLFRQEIRRLCLEHLATVHRPVHEEILEWMSNAWTRTVFGPSTRIEYNPETGSVALKSCTALRTAAKIEGVEDLLLDLQGEEGMQEIGVLEGNRYVEWSENRVCLWVGPIRLVKIGCPKCENCRYVLRPIDFSYMFPDGANAQQLSAKRPVREGEELWADPGGSYDKQCSCPAAKTVKKARASLPSAAQSTTSSKRSRSPSFADAGPKKQRILLKLPGQNGGTRFVDPDLGSPALSVSEPEPTPTCVPTSVPPRRRLATPSPSPEPETAAEPHPDEQPGPSSRRSTPVAPVANNTGKKKVLHRPRKSRGDVPPITVETGDGDANWGDAWSPGNASRGQSCRQHFSPPHPGPRVASREATFSQQLLTPATESAGPVEPAPYPRRSKEDRSEHVSHLQSPPLTSASESRRDSRTFSSPAASYAAFRRPSSPGHLRFSKDDCPTPPRPGQLYLNTWDPLLDESDIRATATDDWETCPAPEPPVDDPSDRWRFSLHDLTAWSLVRRAARAQDSNPTTDEVQPVRNMHRHERENDVLRIQNGLTSFAYSHLKERYDEEQTEAQRLSTENQSLHDLVGVLQAEVDQLRSNQKLLEDQLVSAQQQASETDVSAEVEGATARFVAHINDLQEANARLGDENVRLHGEQREKDAERQQLWEKRETEYLEVTARTADHHKTVVEKLDNKTKQLKKKIAEVETERSAQAKEAGDKNTALQSRLTSAGQQLSHKDQRITALTDELNQKHHRMGELESELHCMREELRAVRELADARVEAADARIRALQSEIDRFEMDQLAAELRHSRRGPPSRHEEDGGRVLVPPSNAAELPTRPSSAAPSAAHMRAPSPNIPLHSLHMPKGHVDGSRPATAHALPSAPLRMAPRPPSPLRIPHLHPSSPAPGPWGAPQTPRPKSPPPHLPPPRPLSRAGTASIQHHPQMKIPDSTPTVMTPRSAPSPAPASSISEPHSSYSHAGGHGGEYSRDDGYYRPDHPYQPNGGGHYRDDSHYRESHLRGGDYRGGGGDYPAPRDRYRPRSRYSTPATIDAQYWRR